MKSSIKFLAIIALFFTFSFAANAQRGGKQAYDPEQMAEKETAQMVEKLGLDEAQTAKIKDINLIFAQKMHAAQEENKENREAMKQIKTAIDKEKNAEIQLILTESQFNTYEEMQAQGGKRGGGKGRRGGGSRRGNK